MSRNDSSILTDVEEFIRRYIVMPDHHLRIVATWVLHSWQFSESCPTPVVTPYLYVNSPQKGSGKTLVMDVVEVLARNAMQLTGITAAGLFRLIEAARPTLLIDEVDTIYSGAKNEELRGALNTGYRSGGKIPRFDGKEVVFYSTHCPKLLGGIDNAQLPDTVRDRCIPITMKRATEDERQTIQPFYHYEIEDEAAALCDRIHAWVVGAGVDIRDYKPEVIPGFSPRQWEISRPLIQVGRYLGVEDSIREAIILTFSGAADTSQTQEQRILTVIRTLLADTDRVYVKDIVTALEEDEITLTGKGLSVKLAPFNIRPQTIRIGNTTGKGYYANDFTDTFDRYL